MHTKKVGIDQAYERRNCYNDEEPVFQQEATDFAHSIIIMDSQIKRRTFISTFSLFFQSGYAAVLGLVANLIVTILLSPTIFGIYVTVLSIIAFLNYFSDIGLAASLIQKKELDDKDISTTFTVQQLLIITMIGIGFLLTNTIVTFYRLPPEGTYLYWSLLVGFFISSLKTIPSVFLERQIKFQKLVYVQVVESTVFYAAVSIFALMGWGLNSFTIAVLLRAVVGLILIYSISFWRPKVGISMPHLRALLKFGVPFQASSFLALFKDDLIILYLGRVLGFEALGYIGWAKKWSDAPIRIIMDNVSRVLFPLVSRFQDDRTKLKNISEKILSYQTSLLAPVIIGMMVTVSMFIDIIPKYEKWAPALPIFYILSVSSLILSLSAPFMNLFNALGKVKITFTFMLILTVVNWITTPLFTKQFGMYGFPVAHLIVSITLSFLLIKAKKMLGIHILKCITHPIVSAVIMGVCIQILKQFLPSNLPVIILISVVGAAIYYSIMKYVFKNDVIKHLLSLYEKKA